VSGLALEKLRKRDAEKCFWERGLALEKLTKRDAEKYFGRGA